MAVTFADIAGKRVECAKCGRAGRYRVARLVQQHGGGMTLINWRERLIADCPRRKAAKLDDQCGARFPDLSGLARWRVAMRADATEF